MSRGFNGVFDRFAVGFILQAFLYCLFELAESVQGGENPVFYSALFFLETIKQNLKLIDPFLLCFQFFL